MRANKTRCTSDLVITVKGVRSLEAHIILVTYENESHDDE